MRRLIKTTTMLLLSINLIGCADGLVYGERTSFSLASVRVNEDPAQPVAIKFGFDRSVALVAPPLGGDIKETNGEPLNVEASPGEGTSGTAKGEAVSQFSTFTLTSAEPFLQTGTEKADLLNVRSRFASGNAALAIADHPPVVNAILGWVIASEIDTGFLLDEVMERRNRIFRAIDKISANHARALALVPPTDISSEMANAANAVDPSNQRGNLQDVARLVLKAMVPELRVEDFDEWDAALGVS